MTIVSGAVEQVASREIVGYLEIPRDSEPVPMALVVNDLEVDRVLVPPAADGGRTRFRFPVKDMWRYCGPQDRVSVLAGEQPLPMPDGAAFHVPTAKAREPLSALAARLDAGELIDSWGRLAQPRYEDAIWQRSATELFQQVHDAILEIAGLEIFLIYGSLLGAVREGRPLGHDCDFDTGYISAYSDPAEVMEEAGRIALALQERGFSVEARMTCIHVSDAARTQRIDVFHTYFNDEDELRLPWGAVTEQPFMRSQWQGVEPIRFAGSTVLAPRNAEALIATLYGPNWHIPNPGFDWTRERTTRADEAFFPAHLRPIINWDDYWSYAEVDSPSSFARAVLSLDLEPSLVIDMGCGDGRDAPRFIRSGHTVLGLDRSERAIRSAQGRHLSGDHATFVLCDAEEPDALTRALHGRDTAETPVLFYSRQLLDCIPDAVHGLLFDSVERLAKPGDVIALEFRGLPDNTLSAHHKRSCGRHQVDAAPVRQRLAGAGFTIVLDEEGTQWEKRGSTGVYLHRIVAYKDDDA